MAPQPETQLVNRIRKAIELAHPGAWVFKVQGGPYQTSGVPDLLVCVEGRLIALEVKRQGPSESPMAARRRATPLQLAQIEKIRRAGGSADVVLSESEALTQIAQALNRPDQFPTR